MKTTSPRRARRSASRRRHSCSACSSGSARPRDRRCGVALYLNKTPIPFVSPGEADKARQAAARRPTAPHRRARADRRRRKRRPKRREAAVRLLQDPARAGGAGHRASELRERRGDSRADKPARRPRTSISSRPARSRTRPTPTTRRRGSRSSGCEASVEPTNLPDKGTWYRVRLGPVHQAGRDQPGARRRWRRTESTPPGQTQE